ncbi:MAG: PDDEXK nuclease domain-containing protein [Deltaproteobacteria bacterium]|nr:PDDEXK nuclease domain-containing protein [Deltaproteobacteria bacterium]
MTPTRSRTLLGDLRQLIAEARQDVARQVNSALVLLYWRVGQRIRRDVLKEKRAEYGQRIVSSLGTQLEAEFGRGFSRRNLFNMIRFAEVFPDFRIVQALTAQLGWTHFSLIIYLDDPLKRDFYAEMCRIERWNTRTLGKKIGSMLFERTALSKKPKELIRHELNALRSEDKLTPDLVFRDPYVLDFLGLKDRYIEKDIEDAIMREMENFILELGVGFTFVARQKRIQVDSDDFYLDLLFFHRGLRRLVAIDLKLRDFQPGDKGQMEFYLRWLAKYEQKPGEQSPIGLILCAGKKREQIELLELEKSGIRVASYWTKVLPRKLLQKKLHEAIRHARERLAQKNVSLLSEQ